MPILFTARTSEQPQYTGSGVQTALTGNVGDWVKTIINFRSFVGFESGVFDSISINTSNVWTLSSGSFEDLGFVAGQALIGDYNYAPNPTAGTNTTIDISTLGLTVVSVSGGTMVVSGSLHPSMGTSYNVPGTTANFFFNWINVYADVALTAIDFKYNQILNSQVTTPTLNSFLDGSVTSFKAAGLDASDLVTVNTIAPQLIQSGSTIKTATIIGMGKTDAFNDFEIELVHQIEGIYDQSADLANKIVPSWYASTECITDIYQVKMYATAYDESTALTSDLQNDKLQATANTGWFNQNFNNGVNNYSITDVEFYDSVATQITGLSNSGYTKVKFNINGAGFSAVTSEFNFGIGVAPINRPDLGNKPVTAFGMRCGNTLGELVSYGHTAAAQAAVFNGFANDVAARIDSTTVWFNVINANLVEVEVELSVNTEFTTYINSLSLSDQLFFMWASAGTSGDLATTDRVNISFSNQVFTPVVVPVVLENVELAKFYPTELDYYSDPAINESEGYIFCSEDDYHFGWQIKLDVDTVINSAQIGLAIFEVSSGSLVYTLDKVTAVLNNSLIGSDGTQEINYIDYRNFNYINTFKDNKITIQRLNTLDTVALRGFEFVIPFRIRYEWWLENNQVPAAFYDATQQHNNKNNEWYTKLSADYEIRQFAFLDTTDGSGNNAQYFNDYDLSLKPLFDDKVYTHLIETYGDDTMTSDKLYLSPSKTNRYTADVYGILEDNPTYIKASLAEAGQVFTNTYAEVCIEIEDGAGWLSMWKIRTDQTPEANNPLQPIAGQSTLYTIATAGKIEVQCKIDPSLLPTGSLDFKITVAYGGSKAAEGGGASTDYLERGLIWSKVVNDKVFNPEQREFPSGCCYEILALASTTNELSFQNDIKGLYRDTQSFPQSWTLIRCSDLSEYPLTDNTYGVYFPTGSFTYEPTLTIFQLHWKKVLTLLGEGSYVIKETTKLFFRTTVDSYSCPYRLEEFSFDAAENTVRIESVQNGYIEELGINFKGINFLDHLRFEGKFGYEEHSYDQTFLIDTNNNKQINRQDLTSEFTLNTGLLPHKCITKPLFDFYLRATSLYISDYNNDNHSWDYESFPVVLGNPEEEKYFARNRDAKISIKFKERILKRRVSTCVGDRPLNFLSDAYVFNDQCQQDKDLYWQLDFFETDDVAFIPASALNVGTLTTVLTSTNVGTITISTDGVTYGAFSLPFTPLAGTDYYFKRSTATVTGQYVISGTYV